MMINQNKTQSTMQTRNQREMNKTVESRFDLGDRTCSTLLDYRNYVAVRLVMVTRSIHADAKHEPSRRRRPGHRRRVYIEFISQRPRSLINLSAEKSRSIEKQRCQARSKIRRTFSARQKKNLTISHNLELPFMIGFIPNI